MQLTNNAAPVGTKAPPTPLVQTPVGGSHSRSSSHASSQSGHTTLVQTAIPAQVSITNDATTTHSRILFRYRVLKLKATLPKRLRKPPAIMEQVKQATGGLRSLARVHTSRAKASRWR